MERPLSVGICTYNRPGLFRQCVEGLRGQEKDGLARIIVIDSSTDDDTERYVRDLGEPLILYTRLTYRAMLPAGRNMILASCQTPYLAYLDDDAIPAAGYVRAVVESLADERYAGVTGPTLNSDADLNPTEEILRTAENTAYILPWGEVRSETRRWIPPAPVACTVMIGANMAYRTEVLREAGGFEEDYPLPAFREESDAQVRVLRRDGRPFLYHPDALVHHVVGSPGGIEDVEAQRALYFERAGRNHRFFADRYYPKLLSRLSWILWSRTPPNLWLAAALTLVRRTNYLAWHRGLWNLKKKR